MCDYVQCSMLEAENTINKWLKLKERVKTLIVSFEDELDYDLFYQIEEIQMNIRSQNYPDNVVISFKQLNVNPENCEMTNWINCEDGYWYIIVHEIYGIESFV